MRVHNSAGAAFAQDASSLNAPALASALRDRLDRFVAPLLKDLDAKIDRRLVRTFASTLEAIIRFRHRSYGLLLSELGAYLLSPGHAPAGTKRLSNLLRSPKWSSEVISSFLWGGAKQRVREWRETKEEAYIIWDRSVVEKPESLHAEGLCAVRSSKAARLKRIKPGFFNPPGGRPVFVPGMEWIALMLASQASAPVVCAMRWWSSRGALAQDLRSVELDLLRKSVERLGRSLIHLWDRGFAGSFWVGVAISFSVRFILRWPKRLKLCAPGGEPTNAWKLVRGKKSWEKRLIRDSHTGGSHLVGVLALPVKHADYGTPLWLVVARPGKGREPWYLLTSERTETTAEAWRVVLAYARRWQIEMAFRYNKTELALESPRLWKWENRQKLLMMVTVVYAFLLSLLDAALTLLKEQLLRLFCHRTGKRGHETAAPLYRIRSALSRLWSEFPNQTLLQNPG